MRCRRSYLVALIALLAASLTGCGLVSSAGTFQSTTLPDGSTPLEGANLTVTSKNFTESVLLGKITATYLAAAGANITDMTNAPGSASSRQAQLNGTADILWEYTGTAWIAYLGETETIADPQELWQRVHDTELAQNNLVWLPPANFNNTYAFAAAADTAQRLGVTTMSEMAALPIADRTFCVNDEFFSRPDGFRPMLEAYGIPLEAPDGVPLNQVYSMDSGVVYSATANSSPCNFGMVYTTDGRIKNLNLTVLEDDRKFFLPYSGTAVVRKEALDAHPQIADLMATVSQLLNDDVMQDLNGRVDIDGEDPAQVAYDWLHSEGLVT